MELKASSFAAGSTIPARFTCDGSDVSPALSWSEPPAGTKSHVLIMDDPDAPRRTWVHWVIYDLPATDHNLAEGVPAQDTLPSGARQGTNDFGGVGYGGPCPPPGSPHRYYFRLFALDTRLELEAGASQREVERSMRGHVLAQTELMARYGRQSSARAR
jgi:Raf kinase inhibitor-like YbhB/YbcL family protein